MRLGTRGGGSDRSLGPQEAGIVLEHRDLHIARLPDAFHGFRIAQLSDIHLEEFTEDIFLEYAVHRINQLKPDLVVLTGDYISEGPRPYSFAFQAAARCGAILGKLQCPLRYAILGNHDVTVSSERVIEALSSNGITPLVDQYVPIERDGQRLWLSGLHDTYASTPDLDAAVPAQLDGPLILLCHEPDYADIILRHPRAGRAPLKTPRNGADEGDGRLRSRGMDEPRQAEVAAGDRELRAPHVPARAA